MLHFSAHTIFTLHPPFVSRTDLMKCLIPPLANVHLWLLYKTEKKKKNISAKIHIFRWMRHEWAAQRTLYCRRRSARQQGHNSSKERDVNRNDQTELFFSRSRVTEHSGVLVRWRTNRRKPKTYLCLCGVFIIVFLPTDIVTCVKTDSVGSGHTGDPRRERSGNVVWLSLQAWRRHWHMVTLLSPSTKHRHLSTENKFSFSLTSRMSLLSFFTATFWNECPVTAISRDAVAGHQMSHRSSSQTGASRDSC